MPRPMNSTTPKLVHAWLRKISPLVTCLDTEQGEIARETAKCLHGLWIKNLSFGDKEYRSTGHTLNNVTGGGMCLMCMYTIRLWGQAAWFAGCLRPPPAV